MNCTFITPNLGNLYSHYLPMDKELLCLFEEGTTKFIFISFFCLCSHGNEEVLTTLARLHDSLLPSLRRGFHIILTSGKKGLTESSNEMRSNVFVSLKMLSARIVNFGWKLLNLCYLSDEAFVESSPLPATMKMFPTNVEDPAIRADILVQSVRDISGDYSQALEGRSKGTFLQIIDKNHNITSRIELLRNTGN